MPERPPFIVSSADVPGGEVDGWVDGELHRMRAGDLAAFPAGTGICHTFEAYSEYPGLNLRADSDWAVVHTTLVAR